MRKKTSYDDIVRCNEVFAYRADSKCYLPTQEQIREGCREVQQKWDAETETSRRVMGPECVDLLGRILEHRVRVRQ